MLNASPKEIPSSEKVRVGFYFFSSNLRRQPIMLYCLEPGCTPY
jgi:hypothetical protein